MKLLYFAWLRARIGRAGEELVLPSDVQDVAGLLQWLRTRGPGYAEAPATRRWFGWRSTRLCRSDHLISDGDEVALFPPAGAGDDPRN